MSEPKKMSTWERRCWLTAALSGFVGCVHVYIDAPDHQRAACFILACAAGFAGFVQALNRSG